MIEDFSLVLTAEALICRNRLLLKGVGHILEINIRLKGYVYRQQRISVSEPPFGGGAYG